jgi:hypothetical protein
LKIGRECEWLINNGADIDWSNNGYVKYCRLLRDKGLASTKEICNYSAIDAAFYDYWGNGFIDCLFNATENPPFNGWFRRIEKARAEHYSPLYHILLMCFLTGNVSKFVDSYPAGTPFGHPPFVCENRICPHYHIGGAEMIDIVDYGQGLTAYFECSYCGMRYKHKKSTDSREQRIIVDYGHMWLGELHRCCQDPKITNDQTMEILKCSRQTLSNQKRNQGLAKPVLYDVNMEPEEYYKAKVLEICQEYDEVTISLLDKKVPGAYVYLQKRDYEWIRSKVVFDNERDFRLEREKLLLAKLREIIAAYDTDGYPDKMLSYGYIASLIGATRDELRHKMSPNSELRAFLDEIVEHKATWQQERAARIRITNSGQGRTTRTRTTNARQKRKSSACVSLSKRAGLLLRKLREVIATFETEGYPDKQLSYGLLASLIGSTHGELKYKAETHPELQAFLNDIVEYKDTWREERAVKGSKCCLKRDKQIKCAIEQIWANPPQEQVSRNYIAKVAGLGKDVLKDHPYLAELTNGFVETRIEWLKRRLTTAYHSKPIEGRPYSTWAIYHAASIDFTTYNRHRELFVEIVSNLNYEAEISWKGVSLHE